MKIAPFSSHFSSSRHFTKVTLSHPSHCSITFKCSTPIRHFVANLSLKFGDVSAESKGVMDNNITKNVQNI